MLRIYTLVSKLTNCSVI